MCGLNFQSHGLLLTKNFVLRFDEIFLTYFFKLNCSFQILKKYVKFHEKIRKINLKLILSYFHKSSRSPAPGSSRLAMSGVAALNFSSDLEHTTNNITNPLSENINKAMMPPPPPMKPKLQRRIGGFNDSPTGNTTPSPERLSFGRFPRGALVWSSNGKPEPLNNASMTSLQGSKLDFSPLGVLSPFNPSSPLTGVQKATPLPEGPLNNSTNSDHKVKRVC